MSMYHVSFNLLSRDGQARLAKVRTRLEKRPRDHVLNSH